MSKFATERAREFYAQTYDASVPDWPGEIDFYREMVAKPEGGAVLEIACGTGRVAIRLAQDGVEVVGLDLSPAMLEVAREKSAGMSNMRWVQGDMRSFELGEAFDLVIIPGHAFQNIITPEDQVACLACIKRHLNPGGTLVVHLDHQDVSWLGDLMRDKGGVFETAEQVSLVVETSRIESQLNMECERYRLFINEKVANALDIKLDRDVLKEADKTGKIIR